MIFLLSLQPAILFDVVDGHDRHLERMARADMGDWIGLIVFLIISLSGFFSQLKQNRGQPNQGRRQRRPPQRPDQGDKTFSDAAREVRELIRRLAEGEPLDQTTTQRPTNTPSAADRSRPDPRSEQVPHRSSAPPQRTEKELSGRQRLGDEGSARRPREGIRRGQSVADHVREHVSDHELAHLTSDVERSDELLEGHLHDVFDHQLGSFAKQDGVSSVDQGTDADVWATADATPYQDDPTDEKRPSLAEQIVIDLRKPESIRRSVLLAEILRRPDPPFSSR